MVLSDRRVTNDGLSLATSTHNARYGRKRNESKMVFMQQITIDKLTNKRVEERRGDVESDL